MGREKYQGPLEAGGFYHVFNRANSKRDRLFSEDKNYFFFLEKYVKYIRPFAETYAFCLIPNHFHFLIEVRTEEDIRKYLQVQQGWDKMVQAPVKDVLSEAFRRFFISYAMSYNPTDQRARGCLFQRPFSRLPIESTYHFFTEVFYIHNNPVKHGLVSSIEEYTWSSYLPLLYGVDQDTNWLCRDKMIEWFEGEEAFRFFHRNRGDISKK